MIKLVNCEKTLADNCFYKQQSCSMNARLVSSLVATRLLSQKGVSQHSLMYNNRISVTINSASHHDLSGQSHHICPSLQA